MRSLLGANINGLIKHQTAIIKIKLPFSPPLPLTIPLPGHVNGSKILSTLSSGIGHFPCFRLPVHFYFVQWRWRVKKFVVRHFKFYLHLPMFSFASNQNLQYYIKDFSVQCSYISTESLSFMSVFSLCIILMMSVYICLCSFQWKMSG